MFRTIRVFVGAYTQMLSFDAIVDSFCQLKYFVLQYTVYKSVAKLND